MYGHYGWMWGMHWAWWIFWILLVVVLAVLLTRSSSARPAGYSSPDALEILKQRYAKGEISTEEYHERSRVLKEAANLRGPGPS